MTRAIYLGAWGSRADIAESFAIPPRAIRGRVLVAWYWMDYYEGYAVVIGAVADRLWIVSASHCSCHGLEGQWQPEATDLEVLRRRQWWGDPSAAVIVGVLDAWEADQERKAQQMPI